MTTPKRTALEILENAEIDAFVFPDILECALEGFEEEAVEHIIEELNVDEQEAALVYEHIRGVAVGGRLVLVEIPQEDVKFRRPDDQSRAGNPFVWKTRYLARRGLRVNLVSPYVNGIGERTFIFGTETFAPEKFDQLWKIVPEAENPGRR
ncbi:hypothetical protein HFO56_33755 [Rhizobium laguerreae]|uniref:hypothetical protein n=1 Tax=Rhizobium laguerreae TaxID=1076926 RepID=UPI001C90C2BE|nr:hypothetical protein [Rhizobium laguerreae]MBY3157293.1 hypothetical protein [Rhizobium laguerreae]